MTMLELIAELDSHRSTGICADLRRVKRVLACKGAKRSAVSIENNQRRDLVSKTATYLKRTKPTANARCRDEFSGLNMLPSRLKSDMVRETTGKWRERNL
jgi:hypothetical protein